MVDELKQIQKGVVQLYLGPLKLFFYKTLSKMLIQIEMIGLRIHLLSTLKVHFIFSKFLVQEATKKSENLTRVLNGARSAT